MTARPFTPRSAYALVAALALLAGMASTPVFAAPPPSPRPAVAITALHAAGVDLAVDLLLLPGAPSKLFVGLETAGGLVVGSAVLSPAGPGRSTVTVAGGVERFLTDGFDYRLRLRDGAGVEVIEPSAFTVGMSCAEEVCRFVPELGVKSGAAVWLDDRLAAALRAADPAVPVLLAAAVAEDPSLAGAARDLAARLVGEADGSCRCRWVYSTTAATCGDPGITLAVIGSGHSVREDELSARRVRHGAATLETACWSARAAGTETLKIALGSRQIPVAWPRVALAPCGLCSGLAMARASFFGAAQANAFGTSTAETRASWLFDVTVDGSTVFSESDVRSAFSPTGADRDERLREWNGAARTIEWQAELTALLQAPAGVDFGSAEAQFGYSIQTTADAACASPTHVEVGRSGGLHSLDMPMINPIDPDQISVVIGECRPPR